MTGIVMWPEPSKPVAVPVAAPDRAIVLAVASLVAVAALPVQDLAVVAVVAVDALPVTLPVRFPLNAVAVIVFVLGLILVLLENLAVVVLVAVLLASAENNTGYSALVVVTV